MDPGVPRDALKFFAAPLRETRDQTLLLMVQSINGKIISFTPRVVACRAKIDAPRDQGRLQANGCKTIAHHAHGISFMRSCDDRHAGQPMSSLSTIFCLLDLEHSPIPEAILGCAKP